MVRAFWCGAVAWAFLGGWAEAQNREVKVREDKKKVEAEGFWIYNNLAKGVEQAKESGKPIVVVLRCIPCEECVKLDDDLVDRDPRVRSLLEKFVCVRIVSTNGLDLSLFQYDYDQSFAVFFLNADGTIYGRFGTRSHRTSWADDVSIEGLAQALQGALDLHQAYPQNKASLAGKRGPAPDVASPEKYPLLKDKYTDSLNYEGNVVQSCIHCHQIGDAQRHLRKSKKQEIPEQILFQYPHPKSQGLIMDPREKATVSSVEDGSPAAASGFKAGDVIVSLQGQPLLSLADMQWVLHQTSPAPGKLTADVKRGNEKVTISWNLPQNWRQRDDISWRVSSWQLRRMTTGGMVLETLPVEEREKLNTPASDMALRVRSVGQFGPHAAAKKAGFQPGDIIVSVGNRTNLLRETDYLAYCVNAFPVGQMVPITFFRQGKKMTLNLPMQE